MLVIPVAGRRSLQVFPLVAPYRVGGRRKMAVGESDAGSNLWYPLKVFGAGVTVSGWV